MIKIVAWLEKLESNNRAIRYWCQDETQLGLKTIERKQITACGVKPLAKVQWETDLLVISHYFTKDEIIKNVPHEDENYYIIIY